jgi:hypothetical protein
MSMMLRLNEEYGTRFQTFREFCELSESFKPKHTEFGTDGKNGKWNENESHHWTFFSHKPDHHAFVHLSKESGEFGFGTHRGEFTDDVANHYDEEPKHVGEALSVMNKALHVAVTGAKEHSLKQIFIHGANNHLKQVYDKAIGNKFLQKHMESHGFKYSHSFKDRHYFSAV